MSNNTLNFFHSSLDAEAPLGAIETPAAIMTWHCQGVLSIEPREPSHLPGVIISVGVHGDETVPIRLVDQWLARVAADALPVNRPMLFILANPAAASRETRFVDHNMNRLFDPAATAGSAPEALRALELMAQVKAFADRHPDGLHFDLHSTIKPSDKDRFALVPPACAERTLTNLLRWFQRFAVDAWVQNRSAAATFANYSANLGYLSATLELGQVSAPDEPIDRFLPLLDEFTLLAQGPSTPSGHPTQAFQVQREIIRPEGAFEVCIEDFVNFRPLTAGTVIARGETEEWTVEEDGDALLFLNARVPVGQRVALVIRPV